MSAPAWMGGFKKTFAYAVDGDLVILTCRLCWGQLGFTHAATEDTMVAEMRHHLYDPPIPWETTDCRGDSQMPPRSRKTRPGASGEV